MTWTDADLEWLGVSDADSEGDIITISLRTPLGIIQIMAEVEIEGRLLIMHGANIQGLEPNVAGVSNMRALGRYVLEKVDCDEARIESTSRTTGANPGRRTGIVRLRRISGAAPVVE